MAGYRQAGVDVAAGDYAVELMRGAIARTAGPEVIGGVGGFAGLFDATKLTSFRRPLLATSTDGVGTKVVIASRLGIYGTVGIDLVGMVVDDLVVCGAEPLFMTDYVVFGELRPERAAAIVAGVAEGCVRAGCALVGGETAEHPGHFGPDDFDLAGAATGVVEAERLLGPDRVAAGDVVLGLASSGLHSNGFSLVRHILGRPAAGLDLTAEIPGAAARHRGRAGSRHLAPAAGVRRARRAWCDRRGRDGARLQHGSRDGRRGWPSRHGPGAAPAGRQGGSRLGARGGRARLGWRAAYRPALRLRPFP